VDISTQISIGQRKDILAKSAIDLLLKKISGDGLDHVQIQVNTELVVRKSC
jgi:DNA-binding LacI/PurR family transcriptional regulator